jgi:predicted RNA-binding Zn-ribbon protein involved in translation (DUF1610 family)
VAHDSDTAYRCPRCGATSALVLRQPIVRPSQVALKCLQCAHVLRVPRRMLESSAARLHSTTSLD